MNSTLDRIAPTPLARLHLLLDLVLVCMVPWNIGTSVLGGGRLLLLCVVMSAVWVLVAAALRAYQAPARPRVDDQVGVWAAQALVVTLGAVAMAEALGVPPPRLVNQLMVVGFLAFTRTLIMNAQQASTVASQQVLIVGVGPLASSLAEHLESGVRRKRVVGFVPLDGERPPAALASRVVGTGGGLAAALMEFSVDEVYVAGNAVTHGSAMQGAVAVCEERGMPFALPAHSLTLERAQPVGLDRADLGFIHHVEADERPIGRSFKRLFDIVASAFALVVLSPLLLVVAALIKLTSPGAIFFRQPRVGMHGRPFDMLKFRSMVHDADSMQSKLAGLNEQGGPVFKIKNDPRVTRVGRFIRRYSIDELPQLINILRGEMSIVGPRPPVPKEVARYQPWQRRRLSVRPGLTCHWQVSGRNNIAFEEWMLLDLRYIDQWSFLTDLKLIARTFPAVLSGHGAS